MENATAGDSVDQEVDPTEWRATALGAAEEADRLLHASVRAHPLGTLGIAAGVGFVLGIGLPRGAVTMLLGVGARFAGSWLRQEIAQGLQEALRPDDGAAHRSV